MDVIWGAVFGMKTSAILDAWSIEHILSGISVGSTVKHHNHRELARVVTRTHPHLPDPEVHHSWRFDLFVVLGLAYVWETLEHYLETGLAGAAVEYWFQGVEYWPNRLIADPLMMVVGYEIARRWPRAVWPARTLSFAWLVVHIAIFPHSMYLHEVFAA